MGITGAAGNAATRLEAYVSREGAYTAGVIPEVEDLFQRQAREIDVKRREALIENAERDHQERAQRGGDRTVYLLADHCGIGGEKNGGR